MFGVTEVKYCESVDESDVKSKFGAGKLKQAPHFRLGLTSLTSTVFCPACSQKYQRYTSGSANSGIVIGIGEPTIAGTVISGASVEPPAYNKVTRLDNFYFGTVLVF